VRCPVLLLYAEGSALIPGLQAQLQPAQYHTTPALARYFDHVQADPAVRKSADALAPAFALVSLDFSTAPSQERKAPEPKKKEKKEAAAAAIPAPTAEAKEAAAPPKKEKVKKEKAAPAEGAATEGKKKEKSGKAPAAPAEDAGEPIPSMIDLRVGHILDGASGLNRFITPALFCNAQSRSTQTQTGFTLRCVALFLRFRADPHLLGVQQIDFGEETGPRTVVSGLVNYVPIEKMQDKWLVGVVRATTSLTRVLLRTSTVQPQASKHARREELCHGPLCASVGPLAQTTMADTRSRPHQKTARTPASRSSTRPRTRSPETASSSRAPSSRARPRSRS
jgi:hypothetical protein